MYVYLIIYINSLSSPKRQNKMGDNSNLELSPRTKQTKLKMNLFLFYNKRLRYLT